MPLNTLEYSTLLQKKLDERAVLGLTSGWMDANAGQVEYKGGNKIKMPEISTTGLKDYDRDDGYPQGSVSLTFKEYEMTMDRGTSFQLDAMDVDESNFIASATSVVSSFQTEQVVPEIDSYRYSRLHSLIAAAGRNTVYVPAEGTLWKKLQEDIAKVRDVVGEEAPLVITIAQPVKTLLELDDKFTKVLNVAEFKAGIVNTRLKEFNNCFFKPVPSARMKTAYLFKDGRKEGEQEGGFAPAETAKNINWIITPQKAPIAVTKQDKMKIIDPDTYQKADAWFIGYRRYHELWLPERRLAKCWTNAEG
ncbi:MAG: hypothetical protein NC389_09805 [Acetatifactor muris]|nr:hypothetical protein [Acetatifactor muris]